MIFFDKPKPFRAVDNLEYSLYVAFKWDDKDPIPSAAVIYFEENAVLRIAEVLIGPWSSIEEAKAISQDVAERWAEKYSPQNFYGVND